MSVIKVHKDRGYTVMSNSHLREKNMSLKAKGLLSVVLSLPDDWDYSIAGLVAICKENKTSVKSALNELKEFGYLEVIKLFPNQTADGKIGYEYNFFERSKLVSADKNQGVDNLGIEILHLENVPQLNTKEISKDKSNKEIYIRPSRKSTNEAVIDVVKTIEDEELKGLYFDYLDMRKLIKAPMTERSLKLLMNRVSELEPNSIEGQKQLLKNAIMNNWKSVYPLKTDEKKSHSESYFGEESDREILELFGGGGSGE